MFKRNATLIFVASTFLSLLTLSVPQRVDTQGPVSIGFELRLREAKVIPVRIEREYIIKGSTSVLQNSGATCSLKCCV